MKKYTRLTRQDRYFIEQGVRKKWSIGRIAVSIERSKSTVSGEIKRNGGYLGYYAAQAHYERNCSNRKGDSKVEKNPALKKFIQEKLSQKWSPEVISGRWNREHDDLKITHETIYTWIYKQPKLYLLLPRKKKKRGLRPSRKRSKIPNRRSIHERPEHINNRSEIGHYEGDLMFQKGSRSQNILSVVERKSRMIVLRKNKSKHSKVVVGALKLVQQQNNGPLLSITLDNGSEFANHSELGTETYFCDPGSPWQKGAIENVNGIIRRYIDYRDNIKNITQRKLNAVASMINNKPRKILNFLTPNEVYAQLYNKNSESVVF